MSAFTVPKVYKTIKSAYETSLRPEIKALKKLLAVEYTCANSFHLRNQLARQLTVLILQHPVHRFLKSCTSVRKGISLLVTSNSFRHISAHSSSNSLDADSPTFRIPLNSPLITKRPNFLNFGGPRRSSRYIGRYMYNLGKIHEITTLMMFGHNLGRIER